MKRFVLLVLALVTSITNVRPAFAISDPPLFSCSSPIGTRIADYATGVHGIPGNSGTYTGLDQVFRIDADHVLQCFCSPTAQGTQSNWWKVSSLSTEERDFFERRGWHLIPNGAAWGLDPAPYLVKNETYTCGDKGGLVENPGKILGAEVLGATGNSEIIALYASLAIVFGLIAYRASRG
jgi:hypothetical protein